MKKQYWRGVGIGCACLLAIQLVIIVALNIMFDGVGFYVGANHSALGEKAGETLSKMNTLNYYISENYLDDVSDEDKAEGIYKGMLDSLGDPYSCYYTKEEYDELMQDNSGTYCGIGAVVTQDSESGLVTIIRVIKGSGSEEAGLKEGDVITKVSGEDISKVDLTSIVAKMKGKEGTKVEVEIYSKEKMAYETLKIERKKVEIPSVASSMKKDGIGYIAVSSFDELTDEQFIEAVDQLKKKDMKGLIVDLRNNGGGMLTSVVNMLDYMLPKGKMIVSTKDKNGKGEEYKSTSDDYFDLPLVVLVNGNTASASEVFSGAVKDYGIGTLVGTKTFGKGIVQSVIPLSDGTAIKITTSKYYTPNGKNIHGTGIEPDIEVELKTTDKEDYQYEQAETALKKLMKEK